MAIASSTLIENTGQSAIFKFRAHLTPAGRFPNTARAIEQPLHGGIGVADRGISEGYCGNANIRSGPVASRHQVGITPCDAANMREAETLVVTGVSAVLGCTGIRKWWAVKDSNLRPKD